MFYFRNFIFYVKEVGAKNNQTNYQGDLRISHPLSRYKKIVVKT